MIGIIINAINFRTVCILKEDNTLKEDKIKLSNYRERVNRDRFILPPDAGIDFFTNIIDKCINFFI